MNSASILTFVLMTSVYASPLARNNDALMTTQTTVLASYNGILHQLGEYFKGRDLSRRQLTAATGDVTLLSKNDILHELGEYWKGRLAALMSHGLPVNIFSHFLVNSK